MWPMPHQNCAVYWGMAVRVIHITSENRRLLGAIAPDVFDADIKDRFLDVYLANSLHALFVACVDDPASPDHEVVIGQARGIVHFHPDQPAEFYVENLGVTPRYQRQGIATKLMDALIDWGEAQDIDYTWLGTEADNDGAIGFYKRYGFRPSPMIMFDDEGE